MSHIALQRVIVRMMFDPALIDAVYSNAEHALSGVDITEDERAWLTEVDPRAYGIDSHFSGRALYAMAGEYPVSTALTVRTGGDLASFFSSLELHSAVQDGRSLSESFGQWLSHSQDVVEWRVKQTAIIESAMSSLRRPKTLPSGPGYWLGNAVRVVTVYSGILPLFSTVQAQLNTSPDAAEFALDPQRGLQFSQCSKVEQSRLLIEASGDAQMGVERLNSALGDILFSARTGCSLDELLSCARAHGADPGEDVEVIEGLVEDGLLWCSNA